MATVAERVLGEFAKWGGAAAVSLHFWLDGWSTMKSHEEALCADLHAAGSIVAWYAAGPNPRPHVLHVTKLRQDGDYLVMDGPFVDGETIELRMGPAWPHEYTTTVPRWKAMRDEALVARELREAVEEARRRGPPVDDAPPRACRVLEMAVLGRQGSFVLGGALAYTRKPRDAVLLTGPEGVKAGLEFDATVRRVLGAGGDLDDWAEHLVERGAGRGVSFARPVTREAPTARRAAARYLVRAMGETYYTRPDLLP